MALVLLGVPFPKPRSERGGAEAGFETSSADSSRTAGADAQVRGTSNRYRSRISWPSLALSQL